jgi:hypothetical protein
MRTRLPRRVPALMTLVSLSLLVLGPLHLAGVIHGSNGASSAAGAGIPELLIGVVLGIATIPAWRAPRLVAWPIARGAVVFAIVGFLFGLTFTVNGGVAFDLAYHLVGLTALISTLILLLRERRAGRGGSAGMGGRPWIGGRGRFGGRAGLARGSDYDAYRQCSRN